MSEPVKVPLQGGQAKHLAALAQKPAEAQRLFEACVLAIAATVEMENATVSLVLDGPEPHVLLTPNE